MIVTLLVTAYCHCAGCCGEAGQPTASGRMPVVGVTVAGPRWMAFGTRVRVPGVGWRVVQDRMSAKYEVSRQDAKAQSRLDVFLGSHREAKAFGVKVLRVEVEH